MTEPKARKAYREIVRETFTPSRVGILSWALAAIFMGAVGLASFQFGTLSTDFGNRSRLADGLSLPPAGDVETTASAGSWAKGMPVEILEMGPGGADRSATRINQGQIEVLQREIIGLRRRLSGLSEQNLVYSRRIAALEKEVALAKLTSANMSGNGMSGNGLSGKDLAGSGLVGKSLPGTARSKADTTDPDTESDTAGKSQAEPMSGVIITAPAPPTAKNTVTQQPPRPASVGTGSMHSDARAAATERSKEKAATAPAPARQISLSRPDRPQDPMKRTGTARPPVAVKPVPTLPAPETDETQARAVVPQTRVKIVQLPEAAGAPAVTASIPRPSSPEAQMPFDSAPTATTLAPKVMSPSDPAGRLNGGGSANSLKRSDFGAVIGHYTSRAAAAKAWADFKEQNDERMRDLRPLLLERQVAEGGIALLVGPFANAADASLACLHLLDMTEVCRPALYAGDPLVSAARFRESAF